MSCTGSAFTCRCKKSHFCRCRPGFPFTARGAQSSSCQVPHPTGTQQDKQQHPTFIKCPSFLVILFTFPVQTVNKQHHRAHNLFYYFSLEKTELLSKFEADLHNPFSVFNVFVSGTALLSLLSMQQLQKASLGHLCSVNRKNSSTHHYEIDFSAFESFFYLLAFLPLQQSF